MANVKIVNTPPVTNVIPWPVGTIARVRLKNSKKHPDGFLRMHVLIGVPEGANVDADDPKTLKSVRSAALNLTTGSVKGADYGIDKYEVLEVLNNVTVSA